ncbi:S-layer homology domain-containing protein [uncultured Flavonifractor sp.]|uniref:S-layer homology domain-containing protein n=1 Tax=Candidatus Flavonifractor intestinigallinarum TaxID=2838586 RepID=A0A9D2MMF3_9FIRM|nr:S-layer homology domain-containing protein [uncultured Flavonifractor sp.]HJB80559.1 S-layer homology domain-containing protein [Candidatus Flavonifractor intestinigallinarum]
MRNLKRTLSLALAAVMLMGMMVVGAGAASKDFTDASDIKNVEAVDVMVALGVLEGGDKGDFQPNSILTREQAAKIICYLLLGTESAEKLTTNSAVFSDVAANRWSAPYISYCVNLGILAGDGQGHFFPEGKLTGAAFAKMLLVALGYDASVEKYVGSDWMINVSSDAIAAGIVPSGLVLANELSRQDAAQMAFDTLTADMVKYDSKGSVSVGDIVINQNANAEKIAASSKTGYKTSGNDEYQQFCEKYFADLKLNENSNDDFGAPASKWTYKNKAVGTYAQTADATYSEEVQSKELYSDLGLDTTVKADVITDGKANGTFTIQKGNSTDKIGGRGVVVNAYADDDNNVTLVVINTYVGEVSKVTAAKGDDAAYVTVDGMKYETENFAKDDVVLYTKADGVIQTMALAEKVEGVEVTRVTGTTSFVADGTTYKFNSNVTFSSDVKKDSVLDLYLDTYGYVMKVDVSKASSDYAYVIKTGADEGRYDDEANYYAKVLLADGTQTEITVDEDCLGKTTDGFGTKKEALRQMEGDIVEYTKDSKDVYTLKSQADSATGKVEIKKGESAMTFGGTTKYANSKTIFLVQSGTDSKATYTTYTGYANVPSMSKDSGATYTVYCKSGDVATIVFVSGVSATSKDIVYVLSSKAASKVDDSDAGVYYEYKAVVNGEITTVKMDEKIATDGKSDVLYGSISYADKDNEILDTSACDPFSIDKTDDSYSMTGKVTAEAKDDIIGIDNKSYALSSDVELYAVTSGDKIETGALADVAKDGTVTVIVKNGEVITIFYGVSNDSPVGPGVSDSYSVSLAKNAQTSATLDLTVKSTNGSDTAKFTYKVFAYGITAGKDTAVEVSAGEGALVNGTSTVSVIRGTNNTLVYYVVVTVGGDTLTTSTVIGG